MRTAKAIVLIFFLGLCPIGRAEGQEASTSARVDLAASRLVDEAGGITLELALTKPVPYRAYLVGVPPRLVLDLLEADFQSGKPEDLDRSQAVTDLRWGAIRNGWSRFVGALNQPHRISSAEERTGDAGESVIRITLEPVDDRAFELILAAGQPVASGWVLPKPEVVAPPHRRQTGDAPLVVVLDPGHGGIDPGAETSDLTEANVMLGFARELADVLRDGGMTAVLTRNDDAFLSLEMRVTIARAAGADVFLSLHADALSEGLASGATIYKLAEAASDEASAKLAERHDRGDLLAGVDLSAQDDVIATVLMDMARAETQPRADRLADALVTSIRAQGGEMHSNPIQGAAFSVLKSPDIPSLLLEVGFLSSKRDRARLADPAWRHQFQQMILSGLQAWAKEDAAEARLIRQ
ncbi:MAG: N-acetylmuramoyl-L-alanine amidase [Albidovulum sp.]